MVARKIAERRQLLAQSFDVSSQFRLIEESCVPSYIHPNYLAALVAWYRLLVAARFYHRYGSAGRILDFGSGTGEIYHILDTDQPYDFIESNDILVQALIRWIPHAHRTSLEELKNNYYTAIFALDVLEHVDDVQNILNRLIGALTQDGIFILSGPTENLLYKLGRRIVGFGGHYHKTNIYGVESVVGRELDCIHQKTVPLGVPLFRVSIWRNRA